MTIRAQCLLTLWLGAAGALAAGDLHDWQSLAQLQTTDTVRVSMRNGVPLVGKFQSWTLEALKVGTVSANRKEVVKVERYSPGGWSRGKAAAAGAVIGFGTGFAIGAAAGGNCQHSFGPCLSRTTAGAAAGAGGAVAGGVIGALLPRHKKDTIYSAKP